MSLPVPNPMKHHSPTLVLPIRGMTCHSCELLLEEAIGAVPGVAMVHVNHRTGKAEIHQHATIPLNEAALERAVEDAGYTVGHEHLPWLSQQRETYVHLLAGIAIVGVLILVAMMTGINPAKLGTTPQGTPSAGVALAVGLTAGFSTCMALIGGLVLAASARYAQRHPDHTGWQKFVPHLAFNGGRIIGFAVLGGVLGAAGEALKLSEYGQILLTLVIGFVMVLLGIRITGLSPRLAKMSPSLPKFLQWKRTLPKGARSPVITAASTGALSFFLPCGFTLAMQVAALNTGSFAAGALIMGAFAVGTAPGLLGVGGISSAAKGRAGKIFFATAGVVVLLLGAYNAKAAWNYLSASSGGSAGTTVEPGSSVIDPNAPVQELRMEQNAYGYVPNKLTVTQGARVRWIVTSTDQYTCASSLRVPRLGISKNLGSGENVIEFVATEAGTIPFSCSMGMYRGTITVLPKTT